MTRVKRKPLLVNEVQDRILKENFSRIENFFRDEIILNAQWKLITASFAADVTNFKIPHGFGFIPLDVIQTSFKGTGALVFNYELFDDSTIDLTVTGTSASNPLQVRFLLGRMNGGQ